MKEICGLCRSEAIAKVKGYRPLAGGRNLTNLLIKTLLGATSPGKLRGRGDDRLNIGVTFPRNLGSFSATTYYRWYRKYGGLEVDKARRLKQLEEENRRLKRIVADHAVNLLEVEDLLGNCW